MAKGFTINGTDFDDIFEPERSGFSSVTFTGLSPTCTYMARTGNANNPNTDGYYTYNGTPYDAHPKGYKVPKSLSVGGSWSNTQYTNTAPDTTGLTYTVTYQDGTTASVSATLTSPSKWPGTAGTQTATFSYTYHGVTVTATKTASVVEPWTAQTITLTNPNSGLAFRSISGNLYTNSACTTSAATNTKYTGTTFYYKSNETKPSGSYLYYYNQGTWYSDNPSKSDITTYYNEGSLTACLGTSGSCWSGDRSGTSKAYSINLSSGSWSAVGFFNNYYSVRASTF